MIINASIISVGTEILRGEIEDTNASFISKLLTEHNIFVDKRFAVLDESQSIINALESSEGIKIVILTGGLGPTDDDLTRETLSDYLGLPLVFHNHLWVNIENRFKTIPGAVLTENNRRQAMLIEGAKEIPNPRGTACGQYIKLDLTVYFLIPGPPSENRPMLNDSLVEILKSLGYIKGELLKKVFRIYNSGESFIQEKLKDINFTGVQRGYYFSYYGWTDVHISASSTHISSFDFYTIVKNVEDVLIASNFLYTDERPLNVLLSERLCELNYKISFAESITGGNLSTEFVKVPGASNLLDFSCVSYSNDSKIEFLGVSEKNLELHGAVSEEVVKEMVNEISRITGSEVAVSVSGIAGPDGGSSEKPVGTVWIAYKIKNLIFTEKMFFNGDRERVIARTTTRVYSKLLELLNS